MTVNASQTDAQTAHDEPHGANMTFPGLERAPSMGALRRLRQPERFEKARFYNRLYPNAPLVSASDG